MTTSLIAASSTGLKAMPAPNPSSSIAGSTSTAKLPSTGAREKRTRPTDGESSPTASGARSPNFITSFAESPIENAAMIRLAGRNASPTWSGL